MAITKTVNSKISVDAESNLVTYEGLSTDSKPTSEVATNSRFHELDTGKYYFFSAGAWTEIPSSGGGSTNTTETYTGTLDGLKTKLAEIYMEKYASKFVGTSDENTYLMTNDIKNGDLSVELYLDMSNLGAGPCRCCFTYVGGPTWNSEILAYYTGFASSTLVVAMQIVVSFSDQEILGEVTIYADISYNTYSSGQSIDITPYLTSIPYTLTLYWHEMPSA